MLAQIDVPGLMRGQHGVDVEALREGEPLALAGGRGERDGRVDHREHAIGPLYAVVGKTHEERSDGVLVRESFQAGVGLREFSLQPVRAGAQGFLGFLRELLTHIGAVGERRIHDDDAGVLDGIDGVFEFGVVRRLPGRLGIDGVVVQIQLVRPLHHGPLPQ